MGLFTGGEVESPKFAIIEYAFNQHWKDVMTSGCWLTMDESQTPRWYHGPVTQGPEPKHICTGLATGNLQVALPNIWGEDG
jgi:hypothetical protein